MKPKIRKTHTFVLLEIMIAFALVSATILPFFSHPFQHIQKELSTLFEMELERHAQNTLLTLHTLLYKNEIPQEMLFGDTQQHTPFEIRMISVELSPNHRRNYEEKVFIEWEKQKTSSDQVAFALIHFKVQYCKPKKKKILLETQSAAVVKKKI